MTKSAIHKLIASLAILLFGQLSATHSMAEITKWQDLGGGRVRLVTVYDPVSDVVEGIIDVELQPGWVTYWRNPGESGIPPDFNFSKSRGVAVSQPDFPVPVSKKALGIVSIVYQNHVAFPFKASALTSPLSGKLQLDLLMGVCDDICIPAMATLSQDLSKLNRSDFLSSSLIELAKQNIPVENSNDPVLPKILSAKKTSDSAVLIEARLSRTANKLELFAEGEDNWFFYPAKLLDQKENLARFELSLSDLPKDADITKSPLRLTLSVDGTGIERTLFVERSK